METHLLRSVNQDQARLDILDKLDDTSVLVILDWAMKFIPRRYRESQADWFGKRGISWHISVAMRKIAGKLQNVTLVHVFDKSNQDSLYVIAVIDDVICQLKRAMPELKSVNFRQDNAACYHSSATIIGVQNLARKHKVAIRIDFSDPQGGKGPCDRKAAVLKNHMRTDENRYGIEWWCTWSKCGSRWFPTDSREISTREMGRRKSHQRYCLQEAQHGSLESI